jgi:DAACS family dicarboxylate/amino acid:cation (Na+ or H+) symporter
MAHTRILVGLVAGAVAGVALNAALGADHAVVVGLNTWLCGPIGQIFLRLLFMVVMPLVFSSVVLGVAGIGDVRSLGRIGTKTAAFFIGSTVLAAATALVASAVIRPGDFLADDVKQRLLATFADSAQEKAATAAKGGMGIHTIVEMVPKNPLAAMVNGDMVAVLVFSILFGVALTMINSEKREHVVGVVDGIADVCTMLVNIALKAAPLGVFCLIFGVTSRFGLALLPPLLVYVGTVLGTLALHAGVTLSLAIWFLVRHHPLDFLRRVRPSLITAFSTSSSSATLPTNLVVAERELGIPPAVAGFVLPLGSTMCMNGTAIFEGITVLFLCQVFGVELSTWQMVSALLLCVVTAIGAAGVPGGSIPLLVGILVGFGVPAEGIAIVLGVDRFLDMCRTTVNVYGDLIGTAFVARTEGVYDPPVRQMSWPTKPAKSSC